MVVDIETDNCSWDLYPHICDLVIYTAGDIGKLNADNVKHGDLIHIKTDLFMPRHRGVRWKAPYKILHRLNKLWGEHKIQVNILCHNSDYICPSPHQNHQKYLDRDEILTIFSNQSDANHGFKKTKVYPIAQGFHNKDPEIPIWKKKRTAWKDKKNTIVLPPGENNRGKGRLGYLTPRTEWVPELHKLYSDKSWYIDFPDEYRTKDRDEFLQLLNNSKFSLPLPGWFADQPNRFWEALLVHSVPIMKRECHMWKTGVEELCNTHNLPCIFVDDWSELNESLFERDFDFSCVDDTLSMKYWRDFIYKKIGKLIDTTYIQC